MLSIGANLQLLVNGKYGDEHYHELLRFYRGVDTLVQANVISNTVASPPRSPTEGDAYIIPSEPADEWLGHANEIARYTATQEYPVWEFFVPKRNWLVGVNDLGDDGKILRFNGTVWVSLIPEQVE